MTRQNECYLCSSPATTADHVPPLAFFPEKKDAADGEDYRSNLITVPACEACNHGFSADDEYAAYVVLCALGNNSIALTQWQTKAMRAMRKNRAVASYFARATPVIVDGKATIQYKVDTPRLQRVMVRIAKGLYWKEYGQKLAGKWHALSPQMGSSTTPIAPIWDSLLASLRQLPWRTGDAVSSPRVFNYKIIPQEVDPRAPVFLLRFYEGLEFLVIRAPSKPLTGSTPERPTSM
jgi:hypothetical protein